MARSSEHRSGPAPRSNPSRLAPLWAVALLVGPCALVACDGPGEFDAGPDASADAGSDAGRRDAAPLMCTPACEGAEACCPTTGGTECFSLRTDPNHCGRCDVDCVVENRGDSCEFSACVCGSSTLGCTGSRESFCCPGRTAGSSAYCANLDLDATDCGECGQPCNSLRADRCDGGECRCGDGRTACAGTPEDTCCRVGVDIACVDTTTDTFNCGVCDNLCRTGERCEAGTCSTGASCPGGCEGDDVCCGGACCSRRACIGGACVVFDAGTPDAGLPDAGLPGLPDASAPPADAG